MLLLMMILPGKLSGQGLSGPDRGIVGVESIFRFEDDAIIAQPVWMTSGGSLEVSRSGIIYMAKIIWKEPGKKLVSFKDGENTLASIEIEIFPNDGLLPAPVALAGSGIGDTFFKASWSVALPESVSFSMEVSEDSLFSQEIVCCGKQLFIAQHKIITGLMPSNQYYYRVRWHNEYGSSVWSSVVKITTACSYESPMPIVYGQKRFDDGPFDLRVEPRNSEIKYLWFDDQLQNLGAGSTFKAEKLNQGAPFYELRLVDQYGCYSKGFKVETAQVPSPQILKTGDRLSPGKRVVLSLAEQYLRVRWMDNANKELAESETFEVLIPGSYCAEVLQKDVDGRGRSQTVKIMDRWDGMPSNLQVETKVLVSGMRETEQLLKPDVIREEVKVHDGLGRLNRQILVGQTPKGDDWVVPHHYDFAGRESRIFLRALYAGTDIYSEQLLDSAGNLLNATKKLYNGTTTGIDADQRPFSEIEFERSPMDRILQHYGPGERWKQAERKRSFGYSVNEAVNVQDERVIIWSLAPDGMPQKNLNINNGIFPDGSLRVVSEKDENQNETIRYYDAGGKLILEKVQLVSAPVGNDPQHWIRKYFIYDLEDRLRFVLQPELVRVLLSQNRNPSKSELEGMAFQFRYDHRGRLQLEQEPGKDSVLYLYDCRDRLALKQNGNQRSQSPYQWTFTKYDALNRPVLTGIKDTTALLSATSAQNVINRFCRSRTSENYFEKFIGAASENVHGYSNQTYPLVTSGTLLDPDQFLTVYYYDDHQFTSNWPDNLSFQSNLHSKNLVLHTNPSGKVTGQKIKVLDGGAAGGNTWLKSINYYDHDGRLIQTASENYKGGIDVNIAASDFEGKIIRSETRHTESDPTYRDLVQINLIGNKIIRSAVVQGWTAGLSSFQLLPVNIDGWIEFTAIGYSTRAIGLSDVNSNQHYNTIDFAIVLNQNGTISLYEQQSGKFIPGNFGTYKHGDVFRIERTTGKIRYLKNGLPLFTSTTLSNSALMLDVSMFTPGAQLSSLKCSFSTTLNTTKRNFVYDRSGRLMEVRHQFNEQPSVVLTQYEYDETGRPSVKAFHQSSAGSNAAFETGLRYNVRGWLSELTDKKGVSFSKPLVNLKWRYNEPTNQTFHQIRFDGKTSRHESFCLTNNYFSEPLAFDYNYDRVNRFASVTSQSFQNGVWKNLVTTESIQSYDHNGNVQALRRADEGLKNIDQLTYSYSPGFANRLSSVSDAADPAFKADGFLDGNSNGGPDFSYDANGNLLTDLNRGISTPIRYNMLDLPEFIQRGNIRVHFVYSALGDLLQKVTGYSNANQEPVTGILQTDYVGAFKYENDQMVSVDHEEGRMVLSRRNLVRRSNASNPTSLTLLGTTSAITTTNSGRKYLVLTNSKNTQRSGAYLSQGIPVVAGERYLIRFTGYRTSGSAKSSNPVNISLKLNGVDLALPTATLPSTSLSEHTLEQQIIIPTSGTLIPGVAWTGTGLAGEVIYFFELEVFRQVAIDPTYEYFIKDSGDNVRFTITSKPEQKVRTLTYESENSTVEQAEFSRMENARLVYSGIFDRTNNPANGTSLRLSGGTNERYGSACMVSVMPGDSVRAEVYAKFVDPSNTNWTSAFALLMGQIVSGASGVVKDGIAYGGSTASFPYLFNWKSVGNVSDGPKAYLNWLVFDKNFTFIPSASGFTRMTASAREYGQDVPHEKISSPLILIERPGFIYFYLSNEEDKVLEVYFDDFSVYNKNSVLQQLVDYHPLGLVRAMAERENFLEQHKLFGSKETLSDLGLKEYDFQNRLYDPAMGRTWQQEPLALKFDRWSAYSWSGNDPVNHTDPDGRDWYQTQGDPNGKVMWQQGSRRIAGYTNLGSHYTFRNVDENGSEVSVTFDQNTLESMTEMVIGPEVWRTQNPALNPIGCSSCCYKVSKQMVAQDGVFLGNAFGASSINMANEKATIDGKVRLVRSKGHEEGIKIINGLLDGGKPVVVGVNYTPGSVNPDGITDHFIVLAGRLTNFKSGQVSFRYFDAGNWRQSAGTSPENLLYLKNGFYESNHYFGGPNLYYTLSHVVR